MRAFLLGSIFSFLVAIGSPAHALLVDDMRALNGRAAMEWRGIVINLDQVLPYYLTQNAQPVWVLGNKLTPNGEKLLQLLMDAEADGLVASDYVPLALRDLGAVSGARDAVGLELALSAAFVHFARDLHGGRTTPSVTDPEIVIARKPVEATAWLSSAKNRGVEPALRALEPQHKQYFQLRQLLSGYRALAARGGWPQVSKGVVLKPGMADARLVEVRNNLAARGYSGITAGAAPAVYGDDLVPVVQHFQKRHGLDDDGIIGPATLRAMNVTAAERVNQIIVNLERWRWLPVDLGARHVFVNQAGFEMFFFNDNRVIDQRRVIVGKPFHRTPIFSDVIRYADFNPTWTVPPSIAKSEMLPKLQSDPSFIERSGYKIYSGWSEGAREVSPYLVDWSGVSASRFPYKIVQQPGPKNALGQVKFMFPNKFNIYLHDTPSRQLFAKTGRAFSHGCIRVNEPLDFAALLFGIDQNMSRARVDDIIASEKLTRIRLNRGVPVHLAYFTAWVDENGVPAFFEDVYERDLMVGRLLFGEV